MSYRKKANKLLELDPDIAIILESESDQKIDFAKHDKAACYKIWCGHNQHKGILVVSYNPNYRISLHSQYNPEFSYVIPVNVEYKGECFVMLAIWTQKTNSIYTSYVVQAYRAIKYYRGFLSPQSIILGDFNSNKTWDNGDKKEANHSDLVGLLESLSFVSAYHQSMSEGFGRESIPTLFLQKNQNKPYHVDYIFTHKTALALTKDFSRGQYHDWIDASDHMPMCIEIET